MDTAEGLSTSQTVRIWVSTRLRGLDQSGEEGGCPGHRRELNRVGIEHITESPYRGNFTQV